MRIVKATDSGSKGMVDGVTEADEVDEIDVVCEVDGVAAVDKVDRIDMGGEAGETAVDEMTAVNRRKIIELGALDALVVGTSATNESGSKCPQLAFSSLLQSDWATVSPTAAAIQFVYIC